MMLTIYGLPMRFKYQDIKKLIKEQCNIHDFILDNLIAENLKQKIRVGVVNDSDGSQLIKCLDGFCVSGSMIQVIPIGITTMGNISSSNYGISRPNPWAANPPAQWNPLTQLIAAGSRQFMQLQHRGAPTQLHAENILCNIGGPMPGAVLPNPHNYEGPTPYDVVARNKISELIEHQPAKASLFTQPDPQSQFSPGPDKQSFDRNNKQYYHDRPNPVQEPYELKGIKRNPGRISPTFLKPLYGNSSSGCSMSPPRHRGSPNRSPVPHERRLSPGRRILSPGIPLSDRQVPSERQVSPYKGISSSARRRSPPDRVRSSMRGRTSPSLRRLSPVGWRISPQRRSLTPDGSRMSSTLRKNSPHGRRLSPSAWITSERPLHCELDISPDRRRQHAPRSVRTSSSSERHISPRGHRNQVAHSDRYFSETDHMFSTRLTSNDNETLTRKEFSRSDSPPQHARGRSSDTLRRSRGARQISPDTRQRSPNPRSRSPLRNESPGRHNRCSPSDEAQHLKYGYENESKFRVQNVRPAYDHVKELSIRERSTEKELRRDNRDKELALSQIWSSEYQRYVEDKNSQRFYRGHSPKARTRGPFKRHSPSPPSPGRSLTLEHRRSPNIQEAPPPPTWPRQRVLQCHKQTRKQYSLKCLDNEPGERSVEERRRSNVNMKDKKNDDPNWKSRPQSNPPQRFIRSSPEQEYINNRKDLSQRDDLYQCENTGLKENFRDTREKRRDRSFEEVIEPLRDDDKYLRQKEELLKKQEQLSKEIEEICKRANDFTKKTELLRKGESKTMKYETSERCNSTSEFRACKYNSKHHPTQEDFSKQHNDRQLKVKDKDNIELNHKLDPVGAISEKMISKYGNNLSKDQQVQVHNELKAVITRMLFDMFGNKDVAFIERVIKFDSRYSSDDQLLMFRKALSKVSSQSTSLKQGSMDKIAIAAKYARDFPVSTFSNAQLPAPIEPSLNIDLLQPNNPTTTFYQLGNIPHMGVTVNPSLVVPMMNNCQFIPSYPDINSILDLPNLQPTLPTVNSINRFSIYLCKDDFRPFLECEEQALKRFIVEKMFNETSSSQGWAPDFTFNKQENAYRREIVANDEKSMDWLMCLDFSSLKAFNVLLHTTEQLWYVRAAIWLPGHSKCKYLEPLAKLKLQNQHLEGVNIVKWKLVKKICTKKGVRLYVDMPPSSVQRLEKYKKMLSFELEKVSVFLKADAVDKDTFDMGLCEKSLDNPPPQSAPMPALGNDPHAIKLGFPEYQPLPLSVASKIKDFIIYKLFKYLKNGGTSRTDFVKYGVCQRGQFGVVPENEESRRWICSLDLPTIKNRHVVIRTESERNIRHIEMTIDLPADRSRNLAFVMECLRHGNKGVTGLNFGMWKNASFIPNSKNSTSKTAVKVDMDIESVETISKMNFKLDYNTIGRRPCTVTVRSLYSNSELHEVISKLKDELQDSYIVANMQISSDSAEDDDDVILCN